MNGALAQRLLTNEVDSPCPGTVIKSETNSSARPMTYVHRDQSGVTATLVEPHSMFWEHEGAGTFVVIELVTQESQKQFSGFYRALERLSRLPVNWNSYGAEPPNSAAVNAAKAVLNVLRGLDVRPNRMMPSADGGIAIVFTRNDLYADFECFNDGEFFVGLSDQRGHSKVWQSNLNNIAKELQRIRTFLYGQSPPSHAGG